MALLTKNFASASSSLADALRLDTMPPSTPTAGDNTAVVFATSDANTGSATLRLTLVRRMSGGLPEIIYSAQATATATAIATGQGRYVCEVEFPAGGNKIDLLGAEYGQANPAVFLVDGAAQWHINMTAVTSATTNLDVHVAYSNTI